jgi:hypothetical protein
MMGFLILLFMKLMAMPDAMCRSGGLSMRRVIMVIGLLWTCGMI